MREILSALLMCVVILAVAEWGLRYILFERVSYSNSESIDRQLRERDAANDWTMIFIGDSETRWGIDPREIDAAFKAHGVKMKSFNHAFDGFGASWWPRLLSPLLKQPSLHRVETVALGVQMIDSHRVIRESGEDCGALQRPVLTSPLAIDLGVDGLCRVQTWDAKLGRRLFGGLWIVRYSSAVRSLILPRPVFGGGGHQLKFNSRKANDPWRGFQAHRSISQDQTSYDSEFSRWKAQYLPERDFQPLPNDVWENLVIQGGFFDEINREVLASGRKLILYALPTNPVLIDTFNRRNDYFHNSILLKDWAVHRGVVFVDLGIKDRADASEFYSDMRHLSGTGARIYSRELGNALVGATLNASTRVKETRVSH